MSDGLLNLSVGLRNVPYGHGKVLYGLGKVSDGLKKVSLEGVRWSQEGVSLFQPIQVYSKHFQPILGYSTLSQPTPVYSNLFRSIPLRNFPIPQCQLNQSLKAEKLIFLCVCVLDNGLGRSVVTGTVSKYLNTVLKKRAQFIFGD